MHALPFSVCVLITLACSALAASTSDQQLYLNGGFLFGGTSGVAQFRDTKRLSSVVSTMGSMLNTTSPDDIVATKMDAADAALEAETGYIYVLYSFQFKTEEIAESALDIILRPDAENPTPGAAFLNLLMQKVRMAPEFAGVAGAVSARLSNVTIGKQSTVATLPTPPPPPPKSSNIASKGFEFYSMLADERTMIALITSIVVVVTIIIVVVCMHKRHVHLRAEQHKINTSIFLPAPSAKCRQFLDELYTEYHPADRKSVMKQGRDSDGIDAAELLSLMQEAIIQSGVVMHDDDLNIGIAQECVQALDENGDGSLQRKEFVAWVMRGLARSPAQQLELSQQNGLQATLAQFVDALCENIEHDHAASAAGRSLHEHHTTRRLSLIREFGLGGKKATQKQKETAPVKKKTVRGKRGKKKKKNTGLVGLSQHDGVEMISQ